MNVGVLQGSSFLNERFYDHMMKRLEGEGQAIEFGNRTKSTIVKRLVLEFENITKRRLNLDRINAIEIEGLRANPAKRFEHGYMSMSRYFRSPSGIS